MVMISAIDALFSDPQKSCDMILTISPPIQDFISIIGKKIIFTISF